jgi:hypothetical protein
MSHLIELIPKKETYKAVKADVDANAASKDLIDNSIDHAKRQNRSKTQVELRYHPGDDGDEKLVFRDYSGGLKLAELSMVFALGESEKDDIPGSIGAFGIGAKKALMSLGKEFTIRSRHTDAETGHEYTIDQDWLADDDQWTVEATETEMEAGTTELHIRDLNVDWQDIRDDLCEDLCQTYALHLRGETAVTLVLIVDDAVGEDDDVITAPPQPAFSHTPWDGLYPRQYTGIVLDPSRISTPVHVTITVGLLATGDRNEAGVTWVCQNRVVEKANRDRVSGFGDKLPTFDLSKHKRFHARIELRTDGDAAEIPWTSDKSQIHARHPVTQAAQDWLAKTVRRYMRASYGTVDPEFFEPYTDADRYAANDGTIQVVDLGSKFDQKRRGDLKQIQIRDKPEKGFPQVTKMQQVADAHAHLGIKYEYEGWVEPWMRPTYNALVEARREKFGCFTALTPLENAPPDFTQDGRSGESERKRLTELAQQHVSLGVRYTGLAEWEQPRYDRELEEAAAVQGIDVDGVERVDELPEVPDGTPDDDGDTEVTKLTFPFTDGELSVLEDHLGPIQEFSAEKRKEVLLTYFQRLNTAGIRFEARAD